MNYVIQILAAFFGASGFALWFRTEHKKLVKAGLGGVISWGIYLLVGNWLESEPLCYLVATIALTFYAEFMAVKEKTPVTVFLVTGTIPLIPGGSLYQTMTYAVEGDTKGFVSCGISTLLLALAIAVGMLLGTSMARLIFHKVHAKGD